MTDDARLRVQRLVAAARRIADPSDPLGRRAREALCSSTGLSPQGIELGFECLETAPSAAEIDALCQSVPRVSHAHVLLSANVFVAAHRAIALGLAASETVSIRPSRRDPVLAQLLHEASGQFQLVPRLTPEAGSHVWAYGTDETLSELAGTLPEGVELHAHGSGLGIAAIEEAAVRGLALEPAAQALALDTVVFEQRGCLSPRIVVFVGSIDSAVAFAHAVTDALVRFETRIPRGEPAFNEQAQLARFRATAALAGDIFAAGEGIVSVDQSTAPLVPPSGRNLRIACCSDPAPVVLDFAPAVTTVGLAGGPDLEAELRRLLPGARSSALGRMQRPPFDGPVDRRRRSEA